MLITTFEEACAIRGVNPGVYTLHAFSFLPEEHREAFCSLAKLVVVVDALNTNEDGSVWSPDWEDELQRKYDLFFKMGSLAGVAFSYVAYIRWHSVLGVGSRLVFRDHETAQHAVTHFLDLYKSWMVYERKRK